MNRSRPLVLSKFRISYDLRLNSRLSFNSSFGIPKISFDRLNSVSSLSICSDLEKCWRTENSGSAFRSASITSAVRPWTQPSRKNRQSGYLARDFNSADFVALVSISIYTLLPGKGVIRERSYAVITSFYGADGVLPWTPNCSSLSRTVARSSPRARWTETSSPIVTSVAWRIVRCNIPLLYCCWGSEYSP